MSRLVALALASVAVVAVATSGFAASATESGDTQYRVKPRLAVVDFTPLTVRGSSFKARERVTVRLDGLRSAVQRLRATPKGGFVVAFSSVPIVRCHPLTVRALGAAGSRAMRQVQHGPHCRMP
jgi:hypothetical protein